jgi:hypothetical protein
MQTGRTLGALFSLVDYDLAICAFILIQWPGLLSYAKSSEKDIVSSFNSAFCRTRFIFVAVHDSKALSSNQTLLSMYQNFQNT